MYSLAFLAAMVLLIQGASLWLLKNIDKHVRAFGALTVFVAVFGFVAYEKFLNGPLMLSSEFGYLMVAGYDQVFWLRALLLAFAVLAGLSWRVAAICADAEYRFPWFVTIGFLIGLVSASLIEPLTNTYSSELSIHYYDIWWPPMVVWATICLVGCLTTILKWHGRIRIWRWNPPIGNIAAKSAAVAVVAFFAIEERTKAFVDSVWFWELVTMVAAPLSAALVYLMAADRLQAKWKKWLIYVLGLIGVFVLSQPLVSEYSFVDTDSWKLWAIFFAPPALVIVVHQLRLAVQGTDHPLQLIGDSRTVIVRRVVTSLVSLSIVFSLAALLFNFGHIVSWAAITIFFISWAILSDILYRSGILAIAYEWIHDPKIVKGYLIEAAGFLGGGLRWIWARFASVFGAESWYGAVVKIIFGLALLIAITEIPNANQTIVMPFAATNVKDDSTIGGQVADRVVQELSLLSNELRQDVIVQSKTGDRDAGDEKFFKETQSTEPALAKSGSIDVGGIKVPVQLILSFIQQPARWLLNVNVVHGILAKSDTGYVMLASSSNGNAWTIPSDGAGADTFRDNVCGGAGSATSEGEVVSSDYRLSIALNQMPKELAFRILLDSEGSRFTGMTRDWLAYRYYSAGLDAYTAYVARDRRFLNFDNLNRAIDCFRKATTIDPIFARAYFRLGLALQTDLQPIAARGAFRQALNADPAFSPAKLALADHQANITVFQPTALPESRSAAVEGDPQGAAHLWQSVIYDPDVAWLDRASAFRGLALLELGLLRQDYADTSAGWLTHKAAALSAYYLIKRSLRLYERQPEEVRSDPEIAASYASAINDTGVIIESVSWQRGTVPYVDWRCTDGSSNDEIEIWHAGPYFEDALPYYIEAAKRLPDDVVVQCNVASAALNVGDSTYMDSLRDISQYRQYAGDRIQISPEDEILDRLWTLHRKLSEYQEAINSDPSDVASMNKYAYTYYLYRRNHPDVGDNAFYLLDAGLRAEVYARDSVRIGIATQDPQTLVYKSTLGELLIALGRPEEAVEILLEIAGDVPDHPSTYEMKWDLAQAYSCVAEKQKDPGARTEYREKAQQILSWIREQDSQRAYPLYAESQDTTDAHVVPRICQIRPEYDLYGDGGVELGYVIAEPKYSKVELCDRNTALVTAAGAGEDELGVWIWGAGGLSRFVPLNGDGTPTRIVLTWEPQNSSSRFNSRLYRWTVDEDESLSEWLPVSVIDQFDTIGACDRAAINIRYDMLAGDPTALSGH